MLPSVAVYVGPGAAIIAPRYATPEGVRYEQESPLVFRPFSATNVGAAVKKAFEAFSVRAKDLRDMKKSDWPSFQASGVKSIKQFEAEFRQISVTFLNSSGMLVRAELPLPGDEAFSLCTTFNPRLPDEKVGESVLGLVDRANRFVG
jgi:hypothetical protein